MSVFDIDYINFKLREAGHTGSAFCSVEELAISHVRLIREYLRLTIAASKTHMEISKEIEEKYKTYGFHEDYIAVEELRKMTIEDFINRFYQEGP